MILDNLSLKTKSILPLTLMAALFGGVVALSASTMSEVTSRYGLLSTRTMPAATAVLRFNRGTALMVVDGLLLQSYECTKGDAAKCSAADKSEREHETATRGYIDQAVALDPSRSVEFANYRQRFEQIATDIKSSLAGGLLDDHASSVAMNDVAARLLVFTTDVTAGNNKINDANAQMVKDLTAASDFTFWLMIGLGALAVVLGAAVSMWISVAKISRPAAGFGAVDAEPGGRRPDGGGAGSAAIGRDRRDGADRAGVQGERVADGRDGSRDRGRPCRGGGNTGPRGGRQGP